MSRSRRAGPAVEAAEEPRAVAKLSILSSPSTPPVSSTAPIRYLHAFTSSSTITFTHPRMHVVCMTLAALVPHLYSLMLSVWWAVVVSMYPCLGEVRRNVSELVSRLFRELKGLRVGITAFADHDSGAAYDIKHQPLSTDEDAIVQFVSTVPATGSCSLEECYELALHEARHQPWRTEAVKTLVIIGDTYPHLPHDNPKHLDWQVEAQALSKQGITVYGVQCLFNVCLTLYRACGRHTAFFLYMANLLLGAVGVRRRLFCVSVYVSSRRVFARRTTTASSRGSLRPPTATICSSISSRTCATSSSPSASSSWETTISGWLSTRRRWPADPAASPTL